jgi:hypothetical protein
MTELSGGLILNPFTEKQTARVTPVMSVLCIHCRRKISGRDGMFYFLGDPYFALIHKECAPYFNYNGLWPHSQPIGFYVNKSKKPDETPGHIPSPGTY